MLSIISWNVNGIRAVEKKGFTDWLSASGADIICIQETKAHPEQLSPALISPPCGDAAYRSYWSSAKKPGYSGTAIYSKTEPDRVGNMAVPEFDDEGRVCAAYYGKLAVISAYFPNSQDGGKRLDYKLAFCKAMFEFCQKLTGDGYNIVLCGDYNIAHKAIDLANPAANEGNAGYLPEERAWMDFFTANGYTDSFRHFCTEAKQYTWWSYRTRARERNIGWRIDYQCVNDSFIDRVQSSEILADVQGSDHCPIRLTIN